MAGAPKGNQNAKRATMWRAALERALARSVKDPEKTVERGLDPIADRVVEAALDGDDKAWQEIANRLDGKPAQAVTVSGDPDNPVHTYTRIERVILSADSPDKDR